MKRSYFKRVLCIGLAVVLNGVPFSSVRVARAAAPPVPARNGCANAWAFNGVWRVRVKGFTPHLDPVSKQTTGWDVTEQWRNGSDQTIQPGDSVTLSQRIELKSGSTVAAQDSTVGSLSQQQVDYHQFPPSAQFTYVQAFLSSKADASDTPVAVVIAFNSEKLRTMPNRPQFSVSPPNYRLKFVCSKGEMAHATAQGGSFEVAAHEGCVNQWLSNGVWRLRATKLEQSMDPSNAGKQLGWTVTEQWTNLTNRKLSPGGSAIMDQQLALDNGDTVSSGNATVTTLNHQKLTFRDFAPGETFTHAQSFWLTGGVTGSVKPVRLLIMFNEKQAAYFGFPPFAKPAAMRISLACKK